MDPNATYRDMMTALQSGNRGEAAELAEVLQEWIRGRGFLPSGLTGCWYTHESALHMLCLVRWALPKG